MDAGTTGNIKHLDILTPKDSTYIK